MPIFPKEQRVLRLLNEAATYATELNRSVVTEIIAAVHKARSVLSAQVTSQGQLPLVLAAIRRHILDVEKHIVGLMDGDETISRRETATLVRIRLVCTELLTIIASTLADVKRARYPERPRLSGFNGS